MRAHGGSGTWDGNGLWHPPTQLGSNIERNTPNKDSFFACNGQTLASMTYDQFMDPRTYGGQTRPTGFRTVSVYHSLGNLELVEYDATRQAVGAAAAAGAGNDYEGWRRMNFTWRNDGSSYATIFGNHPRLQSQRLNQTWATCILPDGFQALQRQNVTDLNVGGMNGWLPLLIALLVLRYPPDVLLQNTFREGRWAIQSRQCEFGRSIVAYAAKLTFVR